MSEEKVKTYEIPVDKFAETIQATESLASSHVDSFSQQFLQLFHHSQTQVDNIFIPSEEAKLKNRYTNILPSKQHRVQLTSNAKTACADYINASHYQTKLPGGCKYILAQAPIEESFADFWHMVWDQNIQLIIMLTKFIENSMFKADRYWPNLNKEESYGQYKVLLMSEDNLGYAIVLKIKITLNGQSREVSHIQYVDWPDHGTPKETYESFKQFYQLYLSYKEKCTEPYVVHCSAGVGRSGVFVLVDTIHDVLHKHALKTIDVFNMVKELRDHRPAAIQTEEQYIFVHEFVKYCIECKFFQ